MGPWGDARMYGRFALGLPGFLRRRFTLEEARAIVRRRLEQREQNFLSLIDRGVYGFKRSPYRALLDLAGCGAGDLREMVRTKGLEPALRALRDAGVYVTFEEFKGREPIVRGGREIPARPEHFDNPNLAAAYRTESGGSTGAGTRVTTDLDHLADRVPAVMLAHHAQGRLGLPCALWRGALPDGSSVNGILTSILMGDVPRRWFTPLIREDHRTPLRFRVATRALVSIARLSGVTIPWPEAVPLARAGVVARWMADTVKREGGCHLSASASVSLRVCLAAKEEGLDLTGALFSGGGEPPTPAKVAGIRATGARSYPGYYFTEAGPVGMMCTRPVDENDQHFLKDHLALITHPRQVPGSDRLVDAFHFTTLLATAPKILLNTQIDDYGTVEQRSCGCPLEECGFTDHIRNIRSFRKLTGEGVTLVGGEMEQILESVLPARFGGSAQDYQLMEEEDERGFTRLSVIVDPAVVITDETAILTTVYEALRRGSLAADLARAHWAQVGTIRVRRMKPVWTARGKLLPLHLVKTAGAPERTEAAS